MKRKKLNRDGVSTSRAQSEEVGLLLVFSISVLSIGVVLMMGVPTLNDAKENAQIERVQTEFGSLDRQISSAAFGGGQTQARINIQQGTFNFDPNAGWINISYRNTTGPTVSENRSMSAVRYRHVDSVISYEMGGIWTRYGDGSSTMASPPDLNLNGNTLSIALMNITSGGFQTGGATSLFTFSHNGSKRLENFSDLGPLEEGNLTLTIHSRHYRGWAAYFVRSGFPTVQTSDTNPSLPPETAQAIIPTGQIEGIIDQAVSDFPSSNCLPTCSSPPRNYKVTGDPTYVGTPGSPIEFDTSNGPIRIALANDNIEFSGEIRVTGDNPVIFFRNTSGNDESFLMDGVQMTGDTVDNPGLFRVYVAPSTPSNPTGVNITGSSEFNGLIYGPNNSNISVVNSEFNGSIVAEKLNINKSSVHQDVRLAGLELPVVRERRITELQVTENNISVR